MEDWGTWSLGGEGAPGGVGAAKVINMKYKILTQKKTLIAQNILQ